MGDAQVLLLDFRWKMVFMYDWLYRFKKSSFKLLWDSNPLTLEI